MWSEAPFGALALALALELVCVRVLVLVLVHICKVGRYVGTYTCIYIYMNTYIYIYIYLSFRVKNTRYNQIHTHLSCPSQLYDSLSTQLTLRTHVYITMREVDRNN